MRIAVVGSGISGLTACHYLHPEHEITLFESNDYIGGHTHTHHVEYAGDQQTVDTGFIVFNDRTYPNFCRLLEELGVESDPTSMSFSVSSRSTGFEYNGTNLNGLFAQRSNLFRPRFHKMIREILRFNREALALAEDDSQTVSEFLEINQYSREFAQWYLLPMGAAIWSCPPEVFMNFPIRFIVEFYEHHGLLSITNRPVWRVIRGGSNEYIKKLIQPFRDRIRLNSPITRIDRTPQTVRLEINHQRTEEFDEVILACHSDQALRMLDAPSPSEKQLLGAFPYSRNEAILHTDESVLPRTRRAWASWNYHLEEKEDSQNATLTYNMNILQHLKSKHVYCVTLNSTDKIDPSKIIKRIIYYHPIFTTNRAEVQKQHDRLIRQNRTSFCGAYWGNGFHEDGVQSALRVCRKFLQNSDTMSYSSSQYEQAGVFE